MAQPALIADAVVDVAVAIIYAIVGRRLSRQRIQGPSRGASIAFSVWWYGLAATGALAALLSLLVAAGVNDLNVLTTLSFFVGIPFTVGLASLVYYLVYLYTGRRALLVPIIAVYVVYNVITLANLVINPPTGYTIQGWRPSLQSQQSMALLVTSLLLLLIPPTVGAGAYLALLTRANDPTTRYRITLVSGSIIAWLVSVLLISQPALAGADVWQAVARGVVILSAITLYFAYQPPLYARNRWGVAPLALDPNPPS